jgi:hypothetical protein
MKRLLPLIALLFAASTFAVSSVTEDFTGFLPAGTDIVAGAWTSDTAGTALSSTDAGQIADLLADLGVASTALLEVGSNTQFANATPVSERVTSTMRLAVVRATSQPTGSAADQIGFYVDDATGHAFIWHNDTVGAGGNEWRELTNGPVIADGDWINLTFVKDYLTDRYTVSINGSTISDTEGFTTAGGVTANGPWFNMVLGGQNQTNLVEIEGSASAPTYVDEIAISSQFVFIADHGTGGQSGDTSGDTFDLVDGGGTLQITVNGTLSPITPASTDTIVIEGTGDDDILNIDAGGFAFPTNITFNGGAGFDTLNITNANGTTLTYTPDGPNSGTVAFDGNTLFFTGLDPITQTGTIADVVINDNAVGDHTITISQPAPGQTRVSCTFEMIDFANPTNSFTLNANADNDAIVTDHTTLLALGPLAGGININGDGHTVADTLLVDGQGNVATDDLAGTINGTGWTLSYATIETVTLINNALAVPALDFWGILILSLSLLICGLRNLPGMVMTAVTGESFRGAAPRAGAYVLALYVAMLATGSPVTMWDSIGLPVVFALTSYLLAWVKENKAASAQSEVSA